MDTVVEKGQFFGAFVARYVPLNFGACILSVMFAGSGLSKFFPAANIKEWPNLPSWFWTGSALWELTSVALFWAGEIDTSFMLLYTFLGGVFSSCTVLASPTSKLPGAVMPILTIGLVASIGHHVKKPFDASSVYALIGGFVFGVVLDNLGMGAGTAGIKSIKKN
jgi:hypothetical protein